MDRAMELRVAVESDLPKLQAWSVALYAEHPGPLPMDAAKVTESFAAFRTQPALGEALVIRDAASGEDVGFLFVARYWSNEYGGFAWIVDELVVDAAWRGRGCGRAALSALERRARAAGAKCLLLEVDADNPRARKLYESLGFHDTTRTPMRRLL